MKNNYLLLFLLISALASAQHLPRRTLTGVILADSISTANVTITNKTAGLKTTSDSQGNFYIKGRENDTLTFLSQSFDPKMLILTSTHMKMEILNVKLDIFVNTLDEVVLSPYNLTGDLEKDALNIKVFEAPKISVPAAMDRIFEIDEQSTPDNVAMPGYVDTRFMMSFGALFDKLGRLIGGPPKPKRVVFTSSKIFPVAVQEKFSESFFLDTMKLKKEEIGLFLTYCESDPASAGLLQAGKEMELLEFLIAKRSSFEEFKNKE